MAFLSPRAIVIATILGVFSLFACVLSVSIPGTTMRQARGGSGGGDDGGENGVNVGTSESGNGGSGETGAGFGGQDGGGSGGSGEIGENVAQNDGGAGESVNRTNEGAQDSQNKNSEKPNGDEDLSFIEILTYESNEYWFLGIGGALLLCCSFCLWKCYKCCKGSDESSGDTEYYDSPDVAEYHVMPEDDSRKKRRKQKKRQVAMQGQQRQQQQKIQFQQNDGQDYRRRENARLADLAAQKAARATVDQRARDLDRANKHRQQALDAQRRNTRR